MVALEAGRILDATILPDFESWDIRRYGDTRIAIKVVAATGTAEGEAGIGHSSLSERVRKRPCSRG